MTELDDDGLLRMGSPEAESGGENYERDKTLHTSSSMAVKQRDRYVSCPVWLHAGGMSI
jgi:hypothetical protein